MTVSSPFEGWRLPAPRRVLAALLALIALVASSCGSGPAAEPTSEAAAVDAAPGQAQAATPADTAAEEVQDLAPMQTDTPADEPEDVPPTEVVGQEPDDGEPSPPEPPGTVSQTFSVDVWADNWFAFYVNGELVAEDSVSIETERSFNKETFTFEASFPMTVAIIAKDFKETDSGIEYIGQANQQMGDGGLIAQIYSSDGDLVAVTDGSWTSLVTHKAPLDKSCERSADPDADCQFEITAEPANWQAAGFDDAGWPAAREYPAAQVSPKDGYNEVVWNPSAQFIWGDDLETSNTILFRTVITGTDSASSDAPAAQAVASTLSEAEYCQRVINSVADAGFADEASVTCEGATTFITSDSYASHEMMTGITATNEQIPLPAPGFFAPVELATSFAVEPLTRDSSLAIAVNGVPIFDYTAGGELSVDQLYVHQPHLDAGALDQLDECGGHTGRGDDYHYHELPVCMIDQMDNRDDNPIIAWGFDGFPLYGNANPDGSAIATGTLDVCNGQLDPIFGYRYHTSIEPPYIIQCLVGEVDLGSMPTIGIDRPSGQPVDVENLAFTHDGLGNGLMTYSYQGEDFYIQATATDDPSCFDLEWKTVTNGGTVEAGVYCHTIRTAQAAPEGQGGGDAPESPADAEQVPPAEGEAPPERGDRPPRPEGERPPQPEDGDGGG